MNKTEFTSRWPLWFLVISTISALVNAIRYVEPSLRSEIATGNLLHTSALFGCLLTALIFGIGIRNRIRCPFLEITDDFIYTGSAMRFLFPRRRLALKDIAELLPGEPRKLLFLMRNGRFKKLDLFEVKKAERSEARRAIDEAIALHTGEVDGDAGSAS